jgi:hypothetical protein
MIKQLELDLIFWEDQEIIEDGNELINTTKED